MSNNRTAENYYNIEIRDFRDYLKLNKKIETTYTFTCSRWIGGEQKVISSEEVPVTISGKENTVLFGGCFIQIEQTPCNYGNVRYWFGCSICGKKATRLFLHGGTNAVWKCRKCANLVYRSQQATKGDFWTWYFKARDIARQIDPDYWEDGFAYLLAPDPHYLFPQKPKGMHWQTYYRMREKYAEYVRRGNILNAASIGAVLGR